MAYCDLLEFYVGARHVFSNKKGKPSREFSKGLNHKPTIFLLNYFTLDLQGFKLFFRLTWEPFEAQFGSIESRFLNNTSIIVRLANAELQSYVYNSLEYQKKESESLRIGETVISPINWSQMQYANWRKKKKID